MSNKCLQYFTLTIAVVGAVPLAGGGKAAVQANVCLRRYLAQKLLCSIADLCRTGGVAGRGSDHHRAQNIK